MKLTHDLPFAADVPLVGLTVEPGEPFEATDEQAALLLENAAFREVKAKKTPTAGKDA